MMEKAIMEKVRWGVFGTCAGTASTLFFIMQDPPSHMEQYYLFVLYFGLTLIAGWWYPIWAEEKEREAGVKQ